MSQESVEIVKRMYEDLNRGDVDAVLAVLDPHMEWWTRRDNPDTTLLRGREGFSAYWAEITGVLAEFRQQPTEVIDAAEYVVVCVHQGARANGVLIDQHEVHVWRFRDGCVVELREYHAKDEALKAAGLAE
jgi:ketosteroid isomerase-like protein